MPRARTDRIAEIEDRLRFRLNSTANHPGEPFPSNRSIARQYGISYQTADRLVKNLVAEGKLERRPGSGTYIPGDRPQRQGVVLFFDRRATREGSIGHRLQQELTKQLKRLRVPTRMHWVEREQPSPPLAPGWYPIIWESAAVAQSVEEKRIPALLLNARPESGLASTFIDSISGDDRSGGAAAAQILTDWTSGPLAILGGPSDDERSNRRIRGFISVASAQVVHAGWFTEDALRCADSLLNLSPAGVFCANDRLAEGLILHCRARGITVPYLVGYDDAPIAEFLGLTTLSVPWKEMMLAAAQLAARRMSDLTSPASQQVFPPIPVIRRPRPHSV